MLLGKFTNGKKIWSQNLMFLQKNLKKMIFEIIFLKLLIMYYIYKFKLFDFFFSSKQDEIDFEAPPDRKIKPTVVLLLCQMCPEKKEFRNFHYLRAHFEKYHSGNN